MQLTQFPIDEENLFKDAFDAFSDHFVNREGFLAQYLNISEETMKYRFLRLASIYKSMVKDGNFIVPGEKEDTQTKIYDSTYKFIAIISIIEALMSDKAYVEFYEWLKNDMKNQTIHIEEQKDLDSLYKKYKADYGSINKTIKFFQELDIEEQNFLISRLKRYVLKEHGKSKAKVIKLKESDIKDFAQQLYDIRSEFMHDAKLIPAFTGIGYINAKNMTAKSKKTRKKPMYISNLSLADLMPIFEVGFIRHFGMKPECPLSKIIYP